MDSSQEGIVIVSMSNLFHIFDKERTAEIKKPKPNPNLNKAITVASKKGNKNLNSNLITDYSHEDKYYSGHSESSEKSPKKEDQYIIKRKRSCCDYFFNLALICFLIIFFNGCYIWIVLFMFSKPKNKMYCFDTDSREFKICDTSDFCPISGIRDIIYSTKYSNVEISKEMNDIKEKYIDFYIKESTIFSYLNKKFSKKKATMSKFGVTIISTYRENYLFQNTFRTGCDNYLLNLILSAFIAIILGNLSFGNIADIIGRKKIIIISSLIQISGSFIIVCISYYIVYKGNEEENAEIHPFNNKKMFNFDYTSLDSYSNIQSFIKSFNIESFEISNINQYYKDNFNSFKKEVLKSKYIKYYFQKSRIILFFGFFLVFLANSTIKTTTLAYLVENALTEDSMNLYFLYFNFTIPLSLIVSLFMLTFLDSFHYLISLISTVQLGLVIIFGCGFYESQRFNFEYAFYTKITDFAIYILGEENLRKNYSGDFKSIYDKNNIEREKVQMDIYYSKDSKDQTKIQNELNNNEENENCTLLSSLLYHSRLVRKRNKKDNVIKRANILGNPFSIYLLMRKEKLIKKHFLLILSFISSLSIVTNLSLSKLTCQLFLPREKLITMNSIINSHIANYTVIYIIILYPIIHYFIKCIGLSLILRTSLIITLISSFIYELFCLASREITNLTEMKYNSIEIIMYKYMSPLTAFVYLVSISNVGMQYSLYFYLTKLTRTIYRCTFLGICHVFIDATFFISLSLEENIEKTYAFVFLFALISLITSLFITSNEDSINITDFRELRFDDKLK